jgi:hypothetical protein
MPGQIHTLPSAATSVRDGATALSRRPKFRIKTFRKVGTKAGRDGVGPLRSEVTRHARLSAARKDAIEKSLRPRRRRIEMREESRRVQNELVIRSACRSDHWEGHSRVTSIITQQSAMYPTLTSAQNERGRCAYICVAIDRRSIAAEAGASRDLTRPVVIERSEDRGSSCLGQDHFVRFSWRVLRGLALFAQSTRTTHIIAVGRRRMRKFDLALNPHQLASRRQEGRFG